MVGSLLKLRLNIIDGFYPLGRNPDLLQFFGVIHYALNALGQDFALRHDRHMLIRYDAITILAFERSPMCFADFACHVTAIAAQSFFDVALRFHATADVRQFRFGNRTAKLLRNILEFLWIYALRFNVRPSRPRLLAAFQFRALCFRFDHAHIRRGLSLDERADRRLRIDCVRLDGNLARLAGDRALPS